MNEEYLQAKESYSEQQKSVVAEIISIACEIYVIYNYAVLPKHNLEFKSIILYFGKV